MLNIFIAEDEPLAAAKLKLFLEKLGEKQTLIFDNGVSLLAILAQEQPDVLFLDINMPGATGMQVMERMQELGMKNVQTIVTSAYEQYAISSFTYNVTDYLLKPYTLERLKTALEKARTNLRLQELDRKTSSETFTIRAGGMTIIVPTADVVFIEAVKDYVRIHLTTGERHMMLGTISSVEERLPANFLRIHRSFIININHVQQYSSQAVNLAGGTELAIGKTYHKQFEEMVKKK